MRGESSENVSGVCLVLLWFGLGLVNKLPARQGSNKPKVPSEDQITVDLGRVRLPSWKVSQTPTSINFAPTFHNTQHRGEVMCPLSPQESTSLSHFLSSIALKSNTF